MATREDTTEPVRLGGMALANGVLVHGPEHWACAIRDDGGAVRVESGRKPFIAAEHGPRALQGPLKLGETFALLPVIRRQLPEARLAFTQPRVAVTMGLSAAVVRGLRSSRLTPATQEVLGALASLVPAAVALRGTALAEYHGAEHVTIGSYEHGEAREREHERCGSHLVGPLMLTSALGGLAARRVRGPLQPLARVSAALGAVAASVELFGWMTRNHGHPLARALARPGHELQHRLVTAEPSAEQLEVARAALAACLDLESRHADGNGEAPPPT